MRLSALLGATALACALSVTAARADDFVIEHVTVIDGLGHAPQPDMSVAIEGNRITTVTPSAIARNLKGRRVNGRGKYLIPGLMDVHIHLRGGVDLTNIVGDTAPTANRQQGVEALASYLYSGLVLLSKDPTADIRNTRSIVFVMKDGRIVDESKLPLAGGAQPRRFAGI
jgi:imidazolonepropionase-like amidohydrolase